MIELLQFPFMQRAFIAGVLLAALLAYLGVLVVIRKMAFFSEGVAHASLAGIAAGVLFNINPIATALVTSVVFAVVMFVVEKRTQLSSDTVIGLLFTSGMALGILLMSLKRGYQPELMSFLFGNILSIHRTDMFLIVPLTVAIGIFLAVNRRRFTLMAMDREMAHLAGLNPDVFQLTLYVILAVSVVLAIKILGVILVSALLIVPVSISKMISSSYKQLVIVSMILSELIVVTGLVLSSAFNLPTGATIVLTGTAVFLLVVLIKGFRVNG